MNFVQIVGYVHDKPLALKNASAARYSQFSVAVTSNFREHNGKFRIDVFPVQLWRGGDSSILEHVKDGDLIAVKGRLEFDGAMIVIIAEQLEHLRLK